MYVSTGSFISPPRPVRSGSIANHSTPMLGPNRDFQDLFPWPAHMLENCARPSATPSRSGRVGLVLILLVQLLARNRPFAHVGELDQEVDHLLLENGRAHARHRRRVLAIEIPHLLLLAGELACPL